MSSGDSGCFAALANLALRRRALCALLLAALTAAAAFALPHVEFTPDVARLLPDDHPHLRLARLLDERAQPARTLWLLLGGDDAAARAPGVAARLRESPYLAEVAAARSELFAAAAAGSPANLAWHLDDDGLERLAARLAPAGRAEAIAELREGLADDPIGGRELAVRDPFGLRLLLAGRDPSARLGFDPGSELALLRGRALLRLSGRADAFDAEFSRELMDDLERRLAGESFEVFGGYAIARADAARVRADLEGSSFWSLVLAIAYLTVSMRSFALPLVVLLPAALAIFWSIPLGSAWFGPLPAVAVAAAAVLIGLGDDFAIHWLAQYRERRRFAGHADAVRGAHARSGPELAIDALVTASAFLMLGTSELSGLFSFGLLLAFGLVLCVLAVLLLLPIVLGDRVRAPRAETSRLVAVADRVTAGRAGRPVAYALIALAVASWGMVAARGVRLSADPEVMRPADDAQAQVRARVERDVGVDTRPLILLWPETAPLDDLAAALERLRTSRLVAFWVGLAPHDVPARRARIDALRAQVAGFDRAMLAELAAAGLAPAPFRAAVAELAQGLAADPPPPPPAQTIDLDGARWRVLRAHATTGEGGPSFAGLQSAAADASGGRLRVYGTPVLIESLERVLRSDLWRTALLSLLATTLLVTAFTRSLRNGLLALVPSAIGVSLTLGALAAAGVPLTLASFMAVPLLVGIGVDEGVHLVGHFRGGAQTLGATGVAVVRTTVTTALGFGALMTVQSPGLRGLGQVVAFGMVMCLAASLLVLPPLLRRRDAGRDVERSDA